MESSSGGPLGRGRWKALLWTPIEGSDWGQDGAKFGGPVVKPDSGAGWGAQYSKGVKL